MSNTQLRHIIYACGKSQKAKNKAAAILRTRKTRSQQQQVSMSGFSMNFVKEKFPLFFQGIEEKFSKKNKGNLKESKISTILKSNNFSGLKVESAGSLCLQGRTPFFPFKFIKLSKRHDYKKGGRRINSRPRKRIEVPEGVPSSRIEQPAKFEVEKEQTQTVIKQEEKTQMNEKQLQTQQTCEGAQSCGLNLERTVDLKPFSATLQTIARWILYGVNGLICLIILLKIMPSLLILLIKTSLWIVSIMIVLSPFILIWYILRACYRYCNKPDLSNNCEYQRQLLMKRNHYFYDRFGNPIKQD